DSSRRVRDCFFDLLDSGLDFCRLRESDLTLAILGHTGGGRQSRMLGKFTTFVVGAGSGFKLGMPLGERLSDIIAESGYMHFDRGAQTNGSPQVYRGMGELVNAGIVGNVQNAIKAGRMIAGGIRHTRSIDNYVNAHQSDAAIQAVAKIAIAEA